MKRVTQTIVKSADNKVPGDCLRASMASLLGLDILQVPHFIMYKGTDSCWFNALRWFLAQFEYDLRGSWRVERDELKNLVNIDGYLECNVPSKTYPGTNCRHSVVIDLDGLIVHDPNPNRAWEGINIYDLPASDSIEILVLHKFERRKV